MQRSIMEFSAQLAPIDVTMAPGFLVKWIRAAIVSSAVRGTRILVAQILNKAVPAVVVFQMTIDTTGTQITELYIPAGYKLRFIDLAAIDPTHDTISASLGVEID